MKNTLPGISREEHRARWHRAYRDIKQGWNAEICYLVDAWRNKRISNRRCLDGIGEAFASLEASLDSVRACGTPYALLLLENIASHYRDETIGVYSLIDSGNRIGNGILSYMNVPSKEENWLSDLLTDHAGIFHTDNGIEVCEMPPASFYFYCDHPGTGGENFAAQLGLCHIFAAVRELMSVLNCESLESLQALTGEMILPLYASGAVSMNTYLPNGNWPCNLVFHQADGQTHITDQETEAQFIMDGILEAPGEFISFVLQYAAGHLPGHVHRLRRRV